MIVIINYGMGNLGSILNMLKKIGAKNVTVSSNVEDIEQAEKIILPGVGSFDNGMKNLEELQLIPVLNEKVLEKQTPVLGICLGMQLLTNNSEEGELNGLAWINGTTQRFRFLDESLKVPHMGWNTVKAQKLSPITSSIDDQSRFYFVHSYFVSCHHREDVLLETDYGLTFTSAVQRENVFGVQFHPEKSHKFGMMLLQDFVNLNIHA